MSNIVLGDYFVGSIKLLNLEPGTYEVPIRLNLLRRPTRKQLRVPY